MANIWNELRIYFRDRGVTQQSIAHEIGVAKETISRALGHSTSNVTDIYINYNNRIVDEANRKVIDFINNL